MTENNAVVKKEKDITEKVLARVNQLEQANEIHFPPNYSYENALKSAWLKLQTVTMTGKDNKTLAIEGCTNTSVANTLFDMVVQGLNPAKNQCYFIPYGNQLTLSTSYFGSVAVTKRLNNVKDVVANCVYQDDVFEYDFDFETGNRVIKSHEQKLENVDFNKMIGAYAVVILEGDETNYVEVMSMAQIEQSWKQRRGGNIGDVHIKFKDQMAMKTVINRACKHFINSSDDSDVLAEAYNNTIRDENEYETIGTEVSPNSIEIDIKQEKPKAVDVEYTEVPGEVKVDNTPTSENTSRGPNF